MMNKGERCYFSLFDCYTASKSPVLRVSKKNRTLWERILGRRGIRHWNVSTSVQGLMIGSTEYWVSREFFYHIWAVYQCVEL